MVTHVRCFICRVRQPPRLEALQTVPPNTIHLLAIVNGSTRCVVMMGVGARVVVLY